MPLIVLMHGRSSSSSMSKEKMFTSIANCLTLLFFPPMSLIEKDMSIQGFRGMSQRGLFEGQREPQRGFSLPTIITDCD